jgi:hypothetical protein
MQIARRWGRTQPQVVRLEKADLDSAKLATIRSFAAALGGQCHVIIELDGATFELA